MNHVHNSSLGTFIPQRITCSKETSELKKRLIFKEKSMVLVLKKGASKKEIESIEKKLKSTKGVNTIKYCGKITLTQDSLTIQKNFRNEWQ